MQSAQRTTRTSVAMLAVFLCTNSTIAAEQSASPPLLDVVATPSAEALALASSPIVSAFEIVRRNPFGSKPLAAAALAQRRGGNQVFNDNQLKGVVADNKASNLTTGMNVISDGAFAGSVGLPTVIQNSGNNVLIQNATIVNVQLK